MNQEQVKSGIRSVILFVAGLVGGYGVHKGWYTKEQLASLLSSEVVLSVVTFIVTAAYGLMMNGRLRLMTAAAGVNPESTTVTTPEKAAASPAKNVVSAGTPEAKTAAAQKVVE